MENSYLKYLINEEVYVIDEKVDNTPEASVSNPAPESSTPVVEEDSTNYKLDISIQGKSDSKIVILNNDASNKFIRQEDENFLKNILSAVKLDITQVALINKHNVDLNVKSIIEQLNPEIILTFNVPQSDVLDSSEPYQVASYQSCKIVTADSLQDISLDKNKKKALWEALQMLFLK